MVKAVEVQRAVSSFTSGKRVSVSERSPAPRKKETPVPREVRGGGGCWLLLSPPLALRRFALTALPKTDRAEEYERGEGRGDGTNFNRKGEKRLRPFPDQSLSGQTSGLRLRHAFVCLLYKPPCLSFMKQPPQSLRKIGNESSCS